jgi:signal transduction histidine kinase/CheY-like chemotaxis protein
MTFPVPDIRTATGVAPAASGAHRRSKAAPIFRALAVASVLIPLLVLGIAGWLSYRSVVAGARTDLLRRLSIAEQQANDELDTDRLALDEVNAILAPYDARQVVSHERALHDRLRAIDDQFPQFDDVTVLDARGAPLVSSRTSLPTRLAAASDRHYLRILKNDRVPFYISGAWPRQAPGQYAFSVARPWQRTPGAFDGAIIASVPAAYYRSFYGKLFGTNPDYSGSLFRTDGLYLAHYPHLEEARIEQEKNSPLMQAIAHDPTRGMIRGRSRTDGRMRIIAYHRLADYPVYVSVGRSWASILRQWRDLMLSYLWFGVPATLALLALSLAGLKRANGEGAALADLRAEAARREIAEAALRQSQKMEAVGRLTGGIAHDFNNHLTVIGTSLELIETQLPPGTERAERLLDAAMQGVRRAAALTHRLLAFSRQQPLNPEPVDIGKLVASMSEMLRRTLGEAVAIETVLAGGLWLTRIDANQLENALLNLAVNARDAMPEGGRLTIETANAHLDDAYAAAHAEVTAGQYVMVAVTDTGTGMSPETIAQAFEPFYTTKPSGQGTGLGLSMVYGFIKQSGGHVKIYSEPGRGTTIKLYLPRLLQPAASGPADAAPAMPRGNGETILLVEDEEPVRFAGIEALHALGYRALAADGAEAALRLLRERSDIALLFTDIGLPGAMSGRALAAAAAIERPGLRVLFTTGYTQNAIIHNGILDFGVQLLSKPFTLQTLADKLHAMLAAPAEAASAEGTG